MLNCLPGINNSNAGGREVFHVPGRNGQVGSLSPVKIALLRTRLHALLQHSIAALLGQKC